MGKGLSDGCPGRGDFHLEVREPGRDWSDQEGFLVVVTSELGFAI